MNACKFCQRPNEGNVGDYYHYHSCWVNNILERIEKDDGTNLTKLRKELEVARYVGD